MGSIKATRRLFLESSTHKYGDSSTCSPRALVARLSVYVPENVANANWLFSTLQCNTPSNVAMSTTLYLSVRPSTGTATPPCQIPIDWKREMPRSRSLVSYHPTKRTQHGSCWCYATAVKSFRPLFRTLAPASLRLAGCTA